MVRGVAFLLIWLGAAGLAQAANVERGRAYARNHCARCHSIDQNTPSPLALAPPFRVLHQRYPVENLEEVLAEGIVTGHPVMPEFRLEAGQIGVSSPSSRRCTEAAMTGQARVSNNRPSPPIARAAWPRPAGTGLHARDDRPAQRVAVTRRLHHRWEDLYDLVLDLERYPAFVPGCRAVKIYSRAAAPAGRTVIVSRMTVGVAGFDVSYANRTTGDAAARRIEVHALDGPLRRLDVLWTFEPDGEHCTRVGFSVDYAFNSAILSALAARAFASMFREILTAFERRAERLFACERQG